MANTQISTGGTNVTGLLGVAFVVLKLTGFINWPWVWVLAPFWIPLVIFFAILGVMALIWLISELSSR